jgi:23S rRNA (cytosine1962-C5)-methyltransferase
MEWKEGSMADVAVTRKGEERLQQGHLWVYRSDVVLSGKTPSPGAIVTVRNPRGQFLGQAFYSTTSQISLRLITTQEVPIDQDFWRQRLMQAIALRQQVVTAAQAYRLVHGEGDLIPALVIDRYQDYLVIQRLCQGTDALTATWIQLLQELLSPRGIIARDDVRVRQLEGLPLETKLLYGEAPQNLVINQQGTQLAVDLMEGQKTGLFLDQRENYQVITRYATGEALDCFTCTGGFALHLARQASRVIAWDVSASSLQQARQNAQLNQLNNIEFCEGNVFDQLKLYDEQQQRFDTIVLDPPAFAKNRAAMANAVRGYKEINLRALKILRPGGVLITCTCSYNVSETLFQEILVAAAADARRAVQLLEKRTQSRDHPILLAVPESYYLKCFILRVL